jgi:hypothetical protein
MFSLNAKSHSPRDSINMNFTVCGTEIRFLFSPHKSSEAIGEDAITQENIILMKLSTCRMTNI